jgi:hypothetical protein
VLHGANGVEVWMLDYAGEWVILWVLILLLMRS